VTQEDRDALARFTAALDANTAAVREIGERVGRLEANVDTLWKSLDGMDRYVRATLQAEHRDTDAAEREAEHANELLREAELERIAHLETHERKQRGGE
jgi:phage-related minor tail protein